MTARRVLVITGSRAEFGLLRSTLEALRAEPAIACSLAVTGSHLLGEHPTIREIEATCPVDAIVEMQQEAEPRTREADGLAFARGVEGFTNALMRIDPEFVLLLGDRIEVFAAATASALLGVRVAHIHGGDVAVGIADDSMRHATTKLSHLHFPATELSARRILAMGERPESVFVVGSPAIDEVDSTPPLDDARWSSLGSPEILVQMHPTGDSDEVEQERVTTLLGSLSGRGRVVVMAPNIDPGCDGIRTALARSGLPVIEHLPRPEFLSLLRRLVLFVGNSSAGLLECAAMGVPVLDIGDRQSGRERGMNVVHTDFITGPHFDSAFEQAASLDVPCVDARFGDGATGLRIANLLATIDLDQVSVRKRWHS